MQSVSSRIWTRIVVFISYGNNDYTTGTSNKNDTWYFLANTLQYKVRIKGKVEQPWERSSPLPYNSV